MFNFKRIIALILTGAMIGSHVSIPIAYANETSEYNVPSKTGDVLNIDDINIDPAEGGLDFSGRELLVGSSSPAIFDGMNVVSNYNEVYLVRFETVEETVAAYCYFRECADFVDINVEFTVSDDETSESDDESFGICDTGEGGLGRLEQLVDEAPVVPSGTIAVIDTGIDSSELVGRVSIIDDGNGMDDNGHGNRVYGFIKEEYPEANVLSIKALGSDGKGSAADIYAAICYAVECGVDIINLSVSAFAAPENELIRDAIDMAFAEGIIVIGAAGNFGRDVKYYIPGNIDSAVVAGACDSRGARLSTSNYGATVDYNVVSDSTSEAAARLSGILAQCMSMGYDGILKSGRVFPADYVPEETEVADEHDYGDDNEQDPWFRVALTERPTEGSYIVNEGTGDSYDPPYYHFYRYTADNGNEALCVDNDHNGFDDETLDNEDELYCYIPMTKSEIYEDKQGSDAEKTGYYLAFYLLTHKIRLGDEDYTIFFSHHGHLAMCYWNWKYNGAADSNSTLPDSFEYDEDMIRGWITAALGEENISACEDYDFHVYRYIYNGSAEMVQSYISYEMVKKPDDILFDLSIRKTDNEGLRVDGADISGAEFTVKYYKGTAAQPYYESIDQLQGVNPDRTWRFRTDSSGRISFAASAVASGGGSDDFYLDKNGRRVLPLGTIVIEETKAPKDYSENGGSYNLTSRNGAAVSISGRRMIVRYTADGVFVGDKEIATGTEITVKNLVLRGDLLLQKNDRVTGRGIQGVHFVIKNLTSGESIEVVTDENGYWSSASSYAPHTKETNTVKAKAGTWIFGTESRLASEINNDAGAFPTGLYEVREIVPKGYYAEDVEPITVEVKAGDEGKVISRTFTNDRFVKLSTRAHDSVTLTQVARAAENARLIDVVEYSDAVKGQSYTLFTKLVSKECGKVIAEGRKVFSAGGSSGSVEVAVDCDLSRLVGKDVVFFEYLYKGNLSTMTGTSIGSHENINDEGQTVHIPDASTSARTEQGLQEASAEDGTVIFDEFKYKNLPSGKYKVQGRLVFTDGTSVLDDNGHEVTCEKNLVNTGLNGSVVLSFELDAKSLEGKSVVVFERLYDEAGHLIVIHENVSDKEQTISFPKVRTLASGQLAGYGEESGSRTNAVFAGEECRIADYVLFENLTPGNSYLIKGCIRYPDGSPVLDDAGETVTAETEFTPEERDGEAVVVFSFDSSFLAGETVYISEELFAEGVLVGRHDDSSDSQQIVCFPKISTHARDDYSGIKTGEWRETIEITDVVSYENIPVGYDYVIRARLMDRLTGEPYKDKNGEEVIAYTEVFTPEKSSGSIAVKISFEADMTGNDVIEGDASQDEDSDQNDVAVNDEESQKGVALVVFEELLICNGEERGIVAKHADIDDEGQTVYYPRCRKETVIEKTEEHYEKIVENNTEKIIEKLTEKEKIIERLREGDDYNIYLYYLELMGLVNIKILTDGDTREDFPVYAETVEEKLEKVVEEKPVNYDMQPKTGDDSMIGFSLLMMVVSAAGVIILKKRKGR